MTYHVQFLGLVCFYRDREGMLAMLPDGRKPAAGIDPHYGTIAIDPDAILESDGWSRNALDSGIFRLPSCLVAIDGLDTSGFLDMTDHADKLPRLGKINSEFRIDPKRAQTVARVPIRQGKLTAYRVPGGTAVMSQVAVPHDGEVGIVVTPRRGTPRYLRTRAGTEIAITNTAGDYRRVRDEQNHFRLYEKLSAQRDVTLRAPEPADHESLSESPSQHFLFTEGISASLTESCSNTGCCP